jgi:hypothetical protein
MVCTPGRNHKAKLTVLCPVDILLQPMLRSARSYNHFGSREDGTHVTIPHDGKQSSWSSENVLGRLLHRQTRQLHRVRDFGELIVA